MDRPPTACPPTPWTLETGENKDTVLPERWCVVRDRNGEMVLYDCAQGPEGQVILETMRRVVACVNFCDCMSTELLEQLVRLTPRPKEPLAPQAEAMMLKILKTVLQKQHEPASDPELAS